MSGVRTQPLSGEEIRQYREEGWINLGRILDDATLQSIRGEDARLRGDPAGQLTIFRSQVAHYSEPIRRFVTSGPQIGAAAQLIGSKDIAIWFTQFVTKLPDAASGKSEFPWHQDNGYVALQPATNITIWVALDDVDERNGCVWVMPRSHHGGLLQHATKTADSWHLTLAVEGDGIPAILKAGEAVAFSGLTLHRSKLNKTTQPRRAFFMEYADVASTFSRGQESPQSILKESNTWVVTGQAPLARNLNASPTTTSPGARAGRTAIEEPIHPSPAKHR